MQIEERNMELKNPKHIKEKLDPDDTVAHVKKDENIEEIPKDLDLLTLEGLYFKIIFNISYIYLNNTLYIYI